MLPIGVCIGGTSLENGRKKSPLFWFQNVSVRVIRAYSLFGHGCIWDQPWKNQNRQSSARVSRLSESRWACISEYIYIYRFI